MFVVFYCARFQANPRKPHMTATKNTFLYIRKTTSLWLWYSSNIGFFVHDYSDADLGGSSLDQKIQSGGY